MQILGKNFFKLKIGSFSFGMLICSKNIFQISFSFSSTPPVANIRQNDVSSSSLLASSPSPVTTFGTSAVAPVQLPQPSGAQSPLLSSLDGTTPQRGHPARHSREWRQARLASLDQESSRADELMNCVREMNVSDEFTIENFVGIATLRICR